MSETELLRKIVSDLFGSLTEPEQIANMCRVQSIQGFVGNSTSCPMVKLVREKINLPIAFAMGKKLGTGRWVIVYDDKQISVPAPLVCDLFVEEFDLKKYPDLIAFPEAKTP